MRQREENARKSQLYDEFADYVSKVMRDPDTNPNLSLRDFSQMPRSGLTHMELVLENVENANKQLFSAVEDFREGAYLKGKENIKTGSQTYVAFIPYVDERKRGVSRSSSSSSSSGRPPSQTRLFLYLFGLMGMVVIAALKTTSSEWNYMLGRK